jgi:NTE family protein
MAPALHDVKSVNLALQGGGAHGAFTWGALDRLLEEERLEIDGISGTSAGAMNAAMVKTGLLHSGRDGARAQLDRFWGSIRQNAEASANPLGDWLRLFSDGPDMLAPDMLAEAIFHAPRRFMQDTFLRSFSPYEWNPFDINPLRDLLDELIDFDAVCTTCAPHLYVCATNVRSGKIRIFDDAAMSTDAILASACLPFLFRAVEIEGEAYWDGGYMGNPALFPLFTGTKAHDIVIVVVNPIERDEVPRTANDILNRVNELSFNSSLLRELRAIHFVHRLLGDGQLRPGEMKDILIHTVRDDATMAEMGAATKLSPKPEMLDHLKARGRETAEVFLRDHWSKLGNESSVDLRAMFD